MQFPLTIRGALIAFRSVKVDIKVMSSNYTLSEKVMAYYLEELN